MKRLGFTDVLMCSGVDVTGIVTRKHDTLEAMGMPSTWVRGVSNCVAAQRQLLAQKP